MKQTSARLADAMTLAARAWEGIQSGHSLEKSLEMATRGVDPRLRGATQDLLYGATRRLALVEALIAKLAQRPPAPPVAALLAVALSQLVARAAADYAIVDQAVVAAKEEPILASAAGFINAVLRRYTREREALEAELLAQPMIRYNAPDWWMARVKAARPDDWQAVLELQQTRPPMILRVNQRRATVAQVVADFAAAGLAASQVGEVAVWLHEPRPVHLIPGFDTGVVSVQDAGSQLAAPFLQVAPGMRVLDACAAPGGKTAHLAETADLDLVALEIDPTRSRRIGENLERLGLAAKVMIADAGEPRRWWDGRPFDRILLDAPCTASGIVRRHPDIPWSRRADDVAQLAREQKRLLEALWPLLAPAGRLLYVVCSLFPEEGQQRIDEFLASHPDARAVSLAPGLPASLPLAPTEAVVAAFANGLPTVHDGFFYALIEKTS
ncbi:MAG: 16S rRNA (cytosine(967)-C(5))-methyltransferase RsmB [Burkholderiaceae bacterium]